MKNSFDIRSFTLTICKTSDNTEIDMIMKKPFRVREKKDNDRDAE